MKKAYMGKILHVNLTDGEITEEAIDDAIYERHIGGMGLGAYVLNRDIPAGADPLGPDNVLGFVSGVLTGTGSLFTGRWMVLGKSPLTGGWGEANCGGRFSPAIKRCGYDGIFFRGTSPVPVFLYIDDTACELRDASDVWGLDTVETEERLVRESGSAKTRVACIGKAGENRSLISGIATDKGRMAARSGLGALMGAKNLKAVVLNGRQRIHVHNTDRMKALSRKLNKWVRFQPPFVNGPLTAAVGALMRILPFAVIQDGFLYKMFLKKWGTVSMNVISPEIGDAPVKNWTGTSRDWGITKSFSTNPDVFTKRQTAKYHCYACPLGCGGICSVKGKYKSTHKPEYETVLCLGGLLMNTDTDSIFYLNEVLNRAGMDTISAGHAVAFAIEAYRAGCITAADTGGLKLDWGKTEEIVKLVEMMVSREGIGDVLADGVQRAARRIGKGSEEFAVHAGGQEPGAHDPRNDPLFALHYSADPAPGRHTTGALLYYEMYQLWKVVKDLPKPFPLYLKGRKYRTDRKKARMAAANSQYMNVINAAGACMFGMFIGAGRIRIFDWLNAATGWDKTPEDYMAAGKRIQTLKQMFNIRQGLDPGNIVVSDRLLGRPPLKRGANKGRTVHIEKLVRDFREEFGWDTETGHPLPETLEALDMQPAAGGA